MNTDWSHLGDYLKEPTTGGDDDSGERWQANLSGPLADLNTRAFFPQAESVNEGHVDKISETVGLLVLPRFARESCINGAMIVRGGVLTFTPVVDTGTTLHGVHTDTVVFSSIVYYLFFSTFTDAHSA